MATLIKKAGSPYWFARFYMPDGKRVDRTTKRVKKREAALRASEIENSERKAAVGGVDTQNQFAALIESATRAATEGKLTIDGVKAYLTRAHRISNPDFEEVTVTALFDRWLKTKEGNITASTLAIYKDAKRHLVSALGAGAEKPAHGITTEDIEAAMQHLRKSNLRGSSVNLSLRAWRRVFRYAVKVDIVTKNPVEGIQTLPEGDSTPRGPFTPEESRKILEVCDEEWRGLCLIGFHSGLRMSDLIKLKKSNIVDGLIRVTPQKTEKGRKSLAIPASLEVLKWLENAHEGYLFPSIRLLPKSTISTRFSRLMKRAGVPREIPTPEGGVLVRSFHSLRHSTNSWLATAGVDSIGRQAILGHSSDSMNRRYTTMGADERREAIRLLPDIASNQ